jgi:site-specific DNA recombinase
LLTGKLYDENGGRYIPTHSNKAGRRYHYYTSQAVIKNRSTRVELGRIPAREIERAVTNALSSAFSSRVHLLKLSTECSSDRESLEQLGAASGHIIRRWINHQEASLRSIIERVTVCQGAIEVSFNPFNLVSDSVALAAQASSCGSFQLKTRIQFQMAPRGVERKIVVAGACDRENPSGEALIKAVVRSRDWYGRVISGKASSFTQLAEQTGVTPRYVIALFPFANFAPACITEILAGNIAPSVTLKRASKEVCLDWERQRV